MTASIRSLFLIATLALAACGAPQPGDGAAADETAPSALSTGTTTVTITAQTLAAVPLGQRYVIDPTKTNVVYRFDSTAAPIDYSRIVFRAPDGSEQPMTQVLDGAKTQGQDLQSAQGHVFTLQPQVTSAGPNPQPKPQICFKICIIFTNICITVCISCCNLQ